MPAYKRPRLQTLHLSSKASPYQGRRKPSLASAPQYGRIMHVGMLLSPMNYMLAGRALAYPCWKGRVLCWYDLPMHMDETPDSSLDAGKEGFRRSDAHLSLGLLCRSHQRTSAQTLGPACEYPDFRGLACWLLCTELQWCTLGMQRRTLRHECFFVWALVCTRVGMQSTGRQKCAVLSVEVGCVFLLAGKARTTHCVGI